MACIKVALPAIDECGSLEHLSSSCSMHATGTSWLAHTSSEHTQPIMQTVSQGQALH